jgi:Mrp family chromosome partitioning ATPase
MAAYLKTWLGVVMTVLMGVGSFVADGNMSVADWISTGMILVGTVAVWRFPNTTATDVAKFIAMVAAGSLPVLGVILSDGMWTGPETVQFIIAVLAAGGVVVVPNVGYVPKAVTAAPPGL